MLSRIAKLAAVLFFALLLCSAKPPKGGNMDFTSDTPLRFGMDQSEAEKIMDGQNWQVSYRVDTPSTLEIAGTYNGEIFYRLGFFEGKCYSIEKRVQVPRAEVERVFTHYADTLGETGEATQSDDNSLYFSRWSKERREISLTADQGKGDVYKLTYEEEDILTSGDARHAQVDELGSVGTQTTVDPITGKPRLLPASNSGDEEAGDDSGGDGENSGDEAKDPKAAKGKDKKEKSDEEGSGDDADKKDKDHKINHDDPNDW